MAAGEGTRMLSETPKVLHRICGKTILDHVLQAMDMVCEQKIVIVGHGKERIMDAYHGRVDFVIQQPGGKGTGYAVKSAEHMLKGKKGVVLVTVGDAPLVLPETFAKLANEVKKGSAAALLSDTIDNPFGYGRVIRDAKGNVCAIVEQKDLQGDQHKVNEMNASVYAFDIESLLWALPQLNNKNAAHEYYLTDVISLLHSAGKKIVSVPVLEKSECLGINDRLQLAQADKAMRMRINNKAMRSGVTLIDPDNTYIEPDVVIGQDTLIYPGCVLQKGSVIGEKCILLPNCRISGSTLAAEVTVENSVILDSEVGRKSTIGPFAYLRPGSRIGSECKIGDFVEIKNSNVQDDSKISHLAYVGDSDVGKRVNLGCGVVFVNYDGKNKTRSTVEDDAFIGCNVNIVSPVHVGKGDYIAAGSTITENVPEGALAIARERQMTKLDWVSNKKTEENL